MLTLLIFHSTQDMDSILVLVPCPTLTRNQTCASLSRDDAIRIYKEQFGESLISKVRDAVFQRLAIIDSLKDLENVVVHEVVDTPATYADQYNVGAGTPFGLSHGLAQLSLARPGPFSSDLPNVCFCGASSRPGNGVPLVLMGAKLVSEKVIPKLRNL
jgi:phytoene dehydrogenase-like protein